MPTANLVAIAIGKLILKPNARVAIPTSNSLIIRTGLRPQISDNTPQK